MFYNIFFYTFVIMQYLKNTTGQSLTFKTDKTLPNTIYITALFEATQKKVSIMAQAPLYKFDCGYFNTGFYSYEVKDVRKKVLDIGTFVIENVIECRFEDNNYSNNYTNVYKCKDN